MKLINLSDSSKFKDLKFAQTIVVIKPTIIPEIIPYLVVFFHHNVITNAGPNEEPKPLQA